MSTRPKSGLGRGFDALLPTDFDPSVLLDKEERVQKVTLQNIQTNTEQPRKQFDTVALQELASSIKRFGILQPIVVRPLEGGRYEIIAGERRFRAASDIGLKTVPVIVRSDQAQERLEIALIENVQRVDLSPLEQAVSIARLHEQFNLSYSDIAKRLSKAETTISNIVRLLQLPPGAQKALEEGRISEGHARAILALKGDDAHQRRLLELIEGQAWSVRQAEQYVVALKQGAKTSATAQSKTSNETPQTQTLGKRLGRKVSLKRTARGGRLELHFKNDSDLDGLIKRLNEV